MIWLLHALLIVSASAAKPDCPDHLLSDLKFGSLLPQENVENTLDNFDAQGLSRMQAHGIANLFLQSPNTRSLGLWISGPSGGGKTHLAVAVAREFHRRGRSVLYFSPETQTHFRRREPVLVAMQHVRDQPLKAWLEERHRSHGRFDYIDTEEALGEFDVIIVDLVSLSDSDRATQYRQLLREIVMHAHRVGNKRLLVTSTVSLRQYSTHLKSSEPDDAAVTIDRLRAMFQPVPIPTLGRSYRKAGASWFMPPSAAPVDPQSSPSSPTDIPRK